MIPAVASKGMWRMIGQQVRSRRDRSIALGAGILVASVSFSLLTADLHTRTGATLIVATRDPAVDARCDHHLAIRDGRMEAPSAEKHGQKFRAPGYGVTRLSPSWEMPNTRIGAATWRRCI
jgi:hypothetical protein